MTTRILISTLAFLLISSFSYARDTGVTISPDNPLVNQPVTFTISFFDSCVPSQTGQPEFDPGDGSASIPFTPTQNFTIMHTYTQAGMFSPSIICPDGSADSSLPISNSTEFLGSSITIGGASTNNPAPIPTLGEWGLILLSLVMLGVGMIYLGQRKRTVQRIN